MRWAAPADEAVLPTPSAEGAAAAAEHQDVLRRRLAAASPWPGGSALLPAPPAVAAAAAQEREEGLPENIHHGAQCGVERKGCNPWVPSYCLQASVHVTCLAPVWICLLLLRFAGRIFITKKDTLAACIEREVFVSNR